VSRTRWPAAVLALCAAAAVGCGIGPGEDQGDVSLTVSRDYGSRVMLQKTDSIRESDTVIRLLDRNADITTRYGGGFVQSIDGLEGTQSGGRSSDWFFYVNGIESPIGSAEYDPSGGDRVWWDYRDWTAAMRVPAVVGSWPEPFVHGFEGDHWPTKIFCLDQHTTCDLVAEKTAGAGIKASMKSTPVPKGLGGRGIATAFQRETEPRGAFILVAAWPVLKLFGFQGPVDLLTKSPGESGVFARFEGDRRPVLDLLNQRGEIAGSVGKGGGLVAALRDGDNPPVWVVTGTDEKGVAAAAGLLGDQLRNHYAVATQPGAGPIAVPVP
jgi:hypothetical protein